MTSSQAHIPFPAEFIGVQCGFGEEYDSFELFTLNQPVGDHPVDSTVSRQTLESHGYFVPSRAELLLNMRRRPERALAAVA